MNQKKLLFFDIDGTLMIESNGIVPKSTIDAIEKAHQNGHLIFINTGRPLSSINQTILDLQPDGFVCGCGTYIQYHDQVLYSFTVDSKRCKELVFYTKKYKVDTVFEGKNAVYFNSTHRHPFVNKVKEDYIDQGFQLYEYDDPNISFDKFASWYDETSDIEAYKKEIEKDFDIIIRDHDFLEIVPKGHSKATGIQFLADYFHVSLDDCFVFGDSYNDVSMLSYVKHAIVMKNAPQDLYKYAYFVTKDIEDDGIAYALQQLHLI